VSLFSRTVPIRTWYHLCLGILEFLAKLWSGSNCVIIPTDGRTIDDEFWAILSSHDPNILYRYQPSGAGQKERAPAEFDRFVTEYVKNYAAKNDFAEDQVRSQLEKKLLETRFEEWSISEELNQQLLRRLTPFHFDVNSLLWVLHSGTALHELVGHRASPVTAAYVAPLRRRRESYINSAVHNGNSLAKISRQRYI
jgi:hypothetical protein